MQLGRLDSVTRSDPLLRCPSRRSRRPGALKGFGVNVAGTFGLASLKAELLVSGSPARSAATSTRPA